MRRETPQDESVVFETALKIRRNLNIELVMRWPLWLSAEQWDLSRIEAMKKAEDIQKYPIFPLQ